MPQMDMKLAISFVDAFLALFILTPLTISFWRGAWNLLDIYLQPMLNPIVDGLLCIAFGYVTCFVQMTASQKMQDAVVGMAQCPWILLSRVYTTIVGLAYVALWRGQFMMMQLAMPSLGIGWFVALAIGSVFLLICVRGVCNLTAAPLNIETDETENYFLGQSDSQTPDKQTRNWYRQLADFAFTVAVVGVLVVFVWGTHWAIFDHLLLPHSVEYSGWSSVGLGYGIVTLVHCGQFQAAAISRRIKSRILRLIFEDFFLLFANVGTINVWRGVWMLIDVYVLPGQDDYVLSNWVTAVVGLVGSFLLFAGNTIIARGGCGVDGESEDGKGCLFSNQYLAKFLNKKLHQFGGEIPSVVSKSDLQNQSSKLKCTTVIENANEDSDAKLTKFDTAQTTYTVLKVVA